MCPEFREQMEAAIILGHLRYAAFGIVPVAKHQRGRRTGLHSGRRDLAIPYSTSLLARLFSALLNPLDAEGAFFHDPILADRDVRIELFRQGFISHRIEPIELARDVRAVVPA